MSSCLLGQPRLSCRTAPLQSSQRALALTLLELLPQGVALGGLELSTTLSIATLPLLCVCRCCVQLQST